MRYLLKNGKTVLIREAEAADAAALIRVLSTADRETPFLARNPGEFHVTVEEEALRIAQVRADADMAWFVAEYEGQVVGQCSAAKVRRSQRYRHRAEVAFVLLRDFCGMGVGGKMMLHCIEWCHDRSVEQIELQVVTKNERALRMYRGFGFEVYGMLPRALAYPDGSYAAEYFMVKQLSETKSTEICQDRIHSCF